VPPWFEALRRYWREEGFDPAGQIFLLAVSGGCDSVALLELFHRIAAPAAGRLFALHVNHGLRPGAIADQAFVENLCRERGIPLRIEALDPATRGRGQSPEMWGREKRYAALAAERVRCGADAVLTAHQRDDGVETFCLRMGRGTGFAGLAGILFRRPDGVVRPLLPVARNALRAWLLDLGTSWREDESNSDVSSPRNWVRHCLLPAWRESEPDCDARIFALTRMAAKLLPAWETWMDSQFPAGQVRQTGGIPLEWLRDEGTGDEVLRRLLPLLGVLKPVPEMMAEIRRQAAVSPDRLRVRVDEASILIGKRGILRAARLPQPGKARSARDRARH
jgi:tRNA(Ile)-lysidine synthetase-like protein